MRRFDYKVCWDGFPCVYSVWAHSSSRISRFTSSPKSGRFSAIHLHLLFFLRNTEDTILALLLRPHGLWFFFLYLFSLLFRLSNISAPSHRFLLFPLHSVNSIPELILSVTASFNSKISIWFFFKSSILKAEAFLFFHISSIITWSF